MAVATPKASFAMCAAAPAKFLGNKGAVFGGLLTYKLGFFEYNSENEDFIHDFDVVLARQPVRPFRLRGLYGGRPRRSGGRHCARAALCAAPSIT